MNSDSDSGVNLDMDMGPTLNEQIIEKLSPIRNVLIDLSGTLHIGKTPTENAPQALQRLRDLGFAVRFVTNTTKESKRLIEERLREIGFVIEENEVFTSLLACMQLIEDRGYRPYYLVDPLAMEDFPEGSYGNPNAVVVGLSPENFDYANLNKAFKYLHNNRAVLIGIHKGRYYETGEGLSLGPGPFIKLLEFADQSNSILVGKPDPHFFRDALLHGFEPNETVMIGDDVEDDVLGAIKADMTGILVQTGKYRAGDEKKIYPVQPAFTVPNFEQAVNYLEIAKRSYMLS